MTLIVCNKELIREIKERKKALNWVKELENKRGNCCKVEAKEEYRKWVTWRGILGAKIYTGMVKRGGMIHIYDVVSSSTNELEKVMKYLIPESQHAFVMEGIFWSSFDSKWSNWYDKEEWREYYVRLIQKKHMTMLMGFWWYILRRMVLGEMWITRMEWCVTTIIFTRLINGSPYGYFKIFRGLRQGDHYLFVMGMKAFNNHSTRHYRLELGWLCGNIKEKGKRKNFFKDVWWEETFSWEI